MKAKPDHGIKTRAGQLLSAFLRKIASEETEMVTLDGEDRMVTKAEAISRQMWKMALGWSEEVVDKNGTRTINHPPDRAMISLLFDRVEGKAPAMMDTGKKQSVADKVSEQGKQRIKAAGNLDKD